MDHDTVTYASRLVHTDTDGVDKDGTWRATYVGNSTYLAVTGSGDHVDVR